MRRTTRSLLTRGDKGVSDSRGGGGGGESLREESYRAERERGRGKRV